MTNPNRSAPGSKTRFRVSLLLLTLLLLAKLTWKPGRQTNASPDGQTVAQAEGTNERFSPVADENAKVWGLAGSLLDLFSGGHRSPTKIQREMDEDEANRRAQEQNDNKRHWDDYDKRRNEERDEREQEMYDHQQEQRAEEQNHYDQQQQQYEQQRADEQQRYDQQQQQPQN